MGDEITNLKLRLILNDAKIFKPQDSKSCEMEQTNLEQKQGTKVVKNDGPSICSKSYLLYI